MKDFWEMKQKFRVECLPLWEESLKSLFPVSMPVQEKWTEINKIVNVLNILGAKKNSSHIFYPQGGGLDLWGASLSSYKKCIELNSNGFPEICMPDSLIFYNLDNDYEWCYFVLHLYQMKESGVYKSNDRWSEELWEINLNCFEIKSDEKPTEESRSIVRLLKGSLIIAAKASAYNFLYNDYRGTDNKYNDELLLKKIRANKKDFAKQIDM